MKKIYTLLFLLPIFLYSHSLLLNLLDNEDGTITIIGEFSTGESATGALVKVKALDSDEILFQKRLPSSSELTIDIPKVKYQVILDGGVGHTIIREGITPKGGFENKKQTTKEKDKAKKPSRTDAKISTSNAVIVSIVMAFILLFATIFVSIKNTNRLINELKIKSR